MTIKLYSLFIICSSLLACSVSRQSNINLQNGNAVTGKYRNLFAEIGYNSPVIKDKLNKAYTQLFYGDANTEAVYYNAGNNADGKMAYIYDVNNDDVRSEGMSYGMMIAVQMNKKQEFDALWNWSVSYLYNNNPLHPAYGFFAWSAKTNGLLNDDMPAPDGEEYYATALYFAAARWGNGRGIYNYKIMANKLLQDMLHRPPVKGLTKHGVTTGVNLFDTAAKMVRFISNEAYANHTDASYQLPVFYEVWSRGGPKEDRIFWQQAAQTSRNYFEKAAHPVTSLTPDYGNFDGTAWAAPWRKESADFRFDAWRTVMNWSVDQAWWGNDKRAYNRTDKLLSFFISEGINNYGNQYTLDGKKLADGQTTGLLSMNAVAALSATHTRKNEFVKTLWNTPVPTGKYRYYDGMLYLIAMLICSGEYRCYIDGQ